MSEIVHSYQNQPEYPINLELLNEGENRTIVSITVSDDDKKTLWPIVHNGFIDLNRKSYEKQDMTYQEYEADMESPDVYKYISYDGTHLPVGYMTVHVGLQNVPWVDREMVMQQQRERDADAIPYYVGTLVVPQELRGMGIANNLLRGALRHFKMANLAHGRNALAFFDCADANHPSLARFIESVISANEAQDGTKVKIDHFFEEAWVREAGGEVHKMAANNSIPGNVIDREHYYSVEVS